MSLSQIQRAVCKLEDSERKRLTAWLLSEFPVLRLEDLMARASQAVERGDWQPLPPGSENIPKGKTLQHALQTAAEIGLPG
jgi:hypothetical protein